MPERSNLFEDANKTIARKSQEFPLHYYILKEGVEDLALIKQLLAPQDFSRALESQISLVNLDYNQIVEFTPLNLAIDYLKTESALWLIENKAKINTRDSYGYYPIHFAVQKNLTSIVKKLIDFGADVNATTNFNLTPIFFAKSCDMLELLIKHKANPNALDNDQRSPLMLYCRKGYYKLVYKILENEIDVNGLDNKNSCALHYAIISLQTPNEDVNLLECVRALISKKANPNIPSQGLSPIEIANMFNRNEISTFLQNLQSQNSSSSQISPITRQNQNPRSTINSPSSKVSSCCQIS